MGRVLCAGSINMDIVVSAHRHPKVGETILGTDLGYYPGGKGANQAVAAARMGATTVMFGRLGDDAFGDELRSFLSGAAVDISGVNTSEHTPTGTALIVVAGGDNTIVVVPGANAKVVPEDAACEIKADDVLISQFEIPLPTIEAFFGAGRSSGARTILNPAPAQSIPESLLSLCNVIVVNETELQYLLNSDEVTPSNVGSLAKQLREGRNLDVIVTLGANGALISTEIAEMRMAGHTVTAVDTTGAGDCFVGALAALLASSVSLERAVAMSNLAASICVTRAGAGPSMPTLQEVEAAD